MLRIKSTVYPDTNLSFNQTYAVQVLYRTKDIRLFNEYCASAKMTNEEIDKCLNEIKTVELFKN